MTPSQARIGVNVFSAAVLASVVVALANFTWHVLGYSGEDPILLPDTGAGSQTGQLAPILALAPFGTAASDPASTNGISGVTLKAIFAASAPVASVALIAGADGTVVQYGVGDATPGGVIEKIETEHVVLRSGTGRRILGFDPDGAGTSTAAASKGIAAPARTPQPVPAVTATPSGVDAIRALIPQSQQGAPPPPTQAPTPTTAPVSAGPPISYKVGAGSARTKV